MLYTLNHISKIHHLAFVASTGIEPVSGASETLILSIVLRGQRMKPFFRLCGMQY